MHDPIAAGSPGSENVKQSVFGLKQAVGGTSALDVPAWGGRDQVVHAAHCVWRSSDEAPEVQFLNDGFLPLKTI